MSYAGNPSLSEETKARIRTTFGQTMQLAGAGRLQEAALGCDFILKMDPLFLPAQSLLDRVTGASGPIDVGDLLEEAAAEQSAPSQQGRTPSARRPSVPGAPVLPPLPPPPRGAVRARSRADDELDLLDDPAGRSAQDEDRVSAADELGLSPLAPIPTPSLQGLAPPSLGGSGQEPLLGSPGGSDEDDRVQALLDEGQASFESGAHQAAIDAWSRIFLIDIDHDEASRRIEEARRLKDEVDREIEERFHTAVDQIEGGQIIEGRALLEQVVAQRPEHLGARDRLASLDATSSEQGFAGGSEGSDHDFAPAAGADAFGPDASDASIEASLADGFGHDFSTEGAAPGSAASAPAVGHLKSPPKPLRGGGHRRFADRRFLTIGLGTLLILLGIGGFLFSNWGTLFPNAPSLEPVTAPVAPPDPVAEATRLYVGGDIDGALAILDAVPEASGRYERAQEQAISWREEQMTLAATALTAEQDAVDAIERRAGMLESARRLYGEGEFLKSAREFNAASKIAPLEGPAAEIFEDAKRQLVPIQQQITFFRDGEWQRVQAPLWRILEADPRNRDARSLLVDSYLNIGIQALRRGTPAEAIEPLAEADGLRPGDPFVQRLLSLATSYSDAPALDMLYSIFVEELAYRR